MISRESMARDIAEAFRNGTYYQCGIDGYQINVDAGIITARKSKFPKKGYYTAFIIAEKEEDNSIKWGKVKGRHEVPFEWIRKALMTEPQREYNTIDDLWGEL